MRPMPWTRLPDRQLRAERTRAAFADTAHVMMRPPPQRRILILTFLRKLEWEYPLVCWADYDLLRRERRGPPGVTVRCCLSDDGWRDTLAETDLQGSYDHG